MLKEPTKAFWSRKIIFGADKPNACFSLQISNRIKNCLNNLSLDVKAVHILTEIHWKGREVKLLLLLVKMNGGLDGCEDID